MKAKDMFYSFRLNLHLCTSTGKFVCNIIYRLKYVLKPSIANIAYGFADPVRRYVNTFHTAVTLLGVCGIQHWTKIGAGGHLPHVLKADAFQRVGDSDDFPTAGRDSIIHTPLCQVNNDITVCRFDVHGNGTLDMQWLIKATIIPK